MLVSVQCSRSVVSDPLQPMDCSTPSLPVHHQPPEFTQTHVHRVGDAIQPSHPLSSPSPRALNLSQHQRLFKWVSSSHQMSRVIGASDQSFQGIFKSWFSLGLTSLISLQSKRLSRVLSNTTVQKHQFFGTQPSLLSSSHICTWLLDHQKSKRVPEKHLFLLYWLCQSLWPCGSQ